MDVFFLILLLAVLCGVAIGGLLVAFGGISEQAAALERDEDRFSRGREVGATD